MHYADSPRFLAKHCRKSEFNRNDEWVVVTEFDHLNISENLQKGENSSDSAPTIAEIVRKYRPGLEPFEIIYKQIHQNPELSCLESSTATLVADFLDTLGFKVHRNIGGHGVAAVLENGPGKIVLLRADMDALPIEEKTGLPYASRKNMKDINGREVPVMHACGHDMHVATLMATTALLSSARSTWSGTLISLFQPDEEQVGGALAMVKDGLYKKVPIPDIILGQHLIPLKTGMVAIRPGPVLTSSDTYGITVFGRGGHGASPQNCIDPILLASNIVVRLQSIVSREVAPSDVAVVTCGSFHGGEAANIIPDSVELKLNIRTYKESVRDHVLNAITRIVNAECNASGCPQKPIITSLSHSPVTSNDPLIVQPISAAFSKYFGKLSVDMEPSMPSEDFADLAIGRIPYAYWNFGGTDAKVWDKAVRKGTLESLPRNHSALFAPVVKGTLGTGVDAMAIAALTFLVSGGKLYGIN